MRPHTILWPALFLGLSSSSLGFQMHGYEAFRSRLDPIVSQNTTSGHIHSVYGSKHFASYVTTDILTSSPCTTIQNQLDDSNYWQPAPYGRNPNGTFTALTNVELSIYYRTVKNS
jgi:hypothetical protein